MITLTQYFMGRDITHEHALGSDLRENARRTVAAANSLLLFAKGAGVVLKPGSDWGMVRSGWRPAAINAATPGASRTSLHMRCMAIDLEDVDHTLAVWCNANASTVLRDLGLWLEHPDHTPTWCHVQTKPPGSGNRVFRP